MFDVGCWLFSALLHYFLNSRTRPSAPEHPERLVEEGVEEAERSQALAARKAGK